MGIPEQQCAKTHPFKHNVHKLFSLNYHALAI
ncbi:Uncharacterised protein [Vibrio cholerae]|nr:Uncharacterised protein [Vibrio cholerae]